MRNVGFSNGRFDGGHVHSVRGEGHVFFSCDGAVKKISIVFYVSSVTKNLPSLGVCIVMFGPTHCQVVYANDTT